MIWRERLEQKVAKEGKGGDLRSGAWLGRRPAATVDWWRRWLDQNWWMPGGQYVERIPKRHWTDEENLDMMLKSADGGYDIIELKRSNTELFQRHRNKWIVSSDVNDAVDQAAG